MYAILFLPYPSQHTPTPTEAPLLPTSPPLALCVCVRGHIPLTLIMFSYMSIGGDYLLECNNLLVIMPLKKMALG